MKTKNIPIDEIICESNRKYTKDTGFEQLVKSIEQYGIIEPSIVRQTKEGYSIIAGRRRIAAAKRLGFTAVDCVVREKDDPVDDEELALTENVNRQDMHPLDEAAAFRRMADNGSSAEEIARYYARSPSAIYKRLRLVSLIEELKGWFRDEILDIAGAALLAELPEEDQKKFYEKYEERYRDIAELDDDEKYSKIDNRSISQFFYQQQKNEIREWLGEECKTCEKRTHNSGNVLFEEFEHLDDVCLDGDCYRTKWYLAIDLALTKKIAKHGKVLTDQKLFFRNGVPAEIYKKATHANFHSVKYEVLKEKDFEFKGETDREKDACWEISEWDDKEFIRVRRIAYKERVKEERPSSKGKTERGTDEGLVKSYGEDAIKAVAAERGTPAVELARELQKKTNSYDFTEEIGEHVYKLVVAKRIEAETSEKEPCRDYFSIFLRRVEDDLYIENGSFIEKNFSDDQKQWLEGILGVKSLKEYFLGLPDAVNCEIQRLFHFLIVSASFGISVPELDELNGIEKKENLFWEYAGMSKDEYRALYIEAAKDVVAKALEPKPKKGGKKKDTAGSDGTHGEDVPADDSGGGSSSSKREKGDDGEDLSDVSNDADNYPFEPDDPEEDPEM